MRVLILGAGATGGYFGGRLAQAGADVTFLLRSARAERVAADGLRIESPDGNITLSVKTVTHGGAGGPYDLCVLSCKAYDLDDAMAAIAPAVSAGTAVLPLLNGLAHYDALDRAFGAENVLGGLCFIMAALEPDGTVRHLAPGAGLTFGERAGGLSPRVDAIAACFAPAQFTPKASSNVFQDAWEKFTFLAALASATCLMRADVGTIVATREGEGIIRGLYAECQAISAGHGYPMSFRAGEQALSFLTKPGSRAAASMLRDLQAGQRVEAEQIQGDLIRRAERLGLDVPLLRAAYTHLQCYEATRQH